MSWQFSLIITGVVFLLLLWVLRKRIRLMLKYKSDDLVDELMAETFWVGQPADQLRDALGEPLDIDQKVLKTKTKEVWKYEQVGKNRYSLKIKLDDGVVVGWDQK